MISIGIPFYNAEEYLEDAISSVLAQTYKSWELILIDDGSSDDSLRIANIYAAKDSRIRVISDYKNMKLPHRLNQLIEESKGDFIARMDADDIMHPERLKKQIEFLGKNKNYDLVSTGLISIDNNNKVRGYRKVNCLYDDFSNIRTSYPIVHPSVMARRSWFDRNKYSKEFPRAEDLELWTRAISNDDFRMAVLPNLLLYYREEGILSESKLIDSYKDILKIYSKYSLGGYLKTSFIKTNLKILVVKVLCFSGNLQRLSSRRNLKFKSNQEKADLQAIIDNIVKNN